MPLIPKLVVLRRGPGDPPPVRRELVILRVPTPPLDRLDELWGYAVEPVIDHPLIRLVILVNKR